MLERSAYLKEELEKLKKQSKRDKKKGKPDLDNPKEKQVVEREQKCVENFFLILYTILHCKRAFRSKSEVMI